MHPVRQVVQALLEEQQVFRAREIVAATGLSRNVVHRHLRRLVAIGALTMLGERRGVRYQLGSSDVRLGSDKQSRRRLFWNSVEELFPKRSTSSRLAYVELARSGLRLQTRRQARILLEPYNMFVALVLDFRGVLRVSEAFIHELYFGNSELGGPTSLQEVNAAPEVEQVIARVFDMRAAYIDEG